MENSNQTTVNVSNEAVASEAYERVQADLATLKPDEFMQVNLDITPAVTTILGVLPEIKALRERIVKELPSFDLASFDKLEDYALALSATHTAVLTATERQSDLLALATEAGDMRERLAGDTKALAVHKLVDPAQLAQLKGGTGYKSLAQDLQVLSKVMLDNWPQIQGKCATTAEDLKLANQMSTRLMRVVGLREQGPAVLAAATEARLRAFTRLIDVYEDARRAVNYLRAPEGDADSIAPALHPGRPRRRPGDAPAPTPGAGVPSAGANGGATVGSTTATLPAMTAADVAAGTAKKGAAANSGPFMS